MRENDVVVRTTEYWYLRWWSAVEQKYRYPYRWKLDENIQPTPRSSTPHRRRE